MNFNVIKIATPENGRTALGAAPDNDAYLYCCECVDQVEGREERISPI